MEDDVDDLEEVTDRLPPRRPAPQGRNAPPAGRNVPPARASGEADDLDDLGGEEGEAGVPTHRKIPTWQEAVGILIEANMAVRTNNPERDRDRGRGGRGRGRGGRGR